MPAFGKKSRARLDTCHRDIVNVLEDVIPHYDFTVIWGRRGEQEQNEAYRLGNSTKKWPNSKHNTKPFELSRAVDIAPWHVDRPHIRWNAEREFIQLSGYILQAAAELDVLMRFGGDWDMDQDLYDVNKPFDLGHFEIWTPR